MQSVKPHWLRGSGESMQSTNSNSHLRNISDVDQDTPAQGSATHGSEMSEGLKREISDVGVGKSGVF